MCFMLVSQTRETHFILPKVRSCLTLFEQSPNMNNLGRIENVAL